MSGSCVICRLCVDFVQGWKLLEHEPQCEVRRSTRYRNGTVVGPSMPSQQELRTFVFKVWSGICSDLFKHVETCWNASFQKLSMWIRIPCGRGASDDLWRKRQKQEISPPRWDRLCCQASIQNDREAVLDVLDVLDTMRKLKHDKWDLSVVYFFFKSCESSNLNETDWNSQIRAQDIALRFWFWLSGCAMSHVRAWRTVAGRITQLVNILNQTSRPETMDNKMITIWYYVKPCPCRTKTFGQWHCTALVSMCTSVFARPVLVMEEPDRPGWPNTFHVSKHSLSLQTSSDFQRQDDAVPTKSFEQRLRQKLPEAAALGADVLYLGHIPGAPWRCWHIWKHYFLVDMFWYCGWRKSCTSW